MSFEISKNRYFMYKPSWQRTPGARMKQMNRAASENYHANAASLGGNLLGAGLNQSSGMIEITARQVQTRLQGQLAAKLGPAKSGLNLTA